MNTTKAAPPKNEDFNKEIYAMMNGMYINDHFSVLKHLHPNILRVGGGKDGWKKIVSDTSKNFQASKMSLVLTNLLEIKNYTKTKSHECFYAYVNVVILKDGEYASAVTKQFGIKKLNDSKWYYADITNKSLADLKKLIPEVPDQFKIYDKEKPPQKNLLDQLLDF